MQIHHLLAIVRGDVFLNISNFIQIFKGKGTVYSLLSPRTTVHVFNRIESWDRQTWGLGRLNTCQEQIDMHFIKHRKT